MDIAFTNNVITPLQGLMFAFLYQGLCPWLIYPALSELSIIQRSLTKIAPGFNPFCCWPFYNTTIPSGLFPLSLEIVIKGCRWLL